MIAQKAFPAPRGIQREGLHVRGRPLPERIVQKGRLDLHAHIGIASQNAPLTLRRPKLVDQKTKRLHGQDMVVTFHKIPPEKESSKMPPSRRPDRKSVV